MVSETWNVVVLAFEPGPLFLDVGFAARGVDASDVEEDLSS